MADTTIDSLQIEINAKAQKANDAIDVLVDKLDVLSNSLGKINNVDISGFFNSLKGFQGNKLPDLTRLANGINKLSNINYSEILNAGQSIRQIASQLQSLNNVKLDDNVMQIANVANAMSRLGGKSIVNATANVPLLANALNQLMVTLSKAPTVNQSIIDMTNALANLASQGSNVGSASESVVNGLNRTNAAAKRASSSTMSLARAFGKFYANCFLLVRGFKGMFNMMESAMELTETVNYFEVTLRNIGESAKSNWEQYGYESADAYANSFAERLRESNEKLTGFTVSETGQISQSVFSGLGINPATATQYSAMFAQVANSIGMTEEASIALSEAFVRLGADWASLRNVDFDVAYEKLASGLAGQSRALRAFGVDITMATLQEIAFANGIEKSVSEMTQSEKAYLRLIAIIEQSEVAFGDLARTLYSPANQMRMLSQGVQNLGTLVGNLFLPVLKRTLPVLNGFVIAMQRIVIAISESMGIDTSGITESTNDMTDELDSFIGEVDEATESAEKFNRATRGWDELNVLGKDTSKGYGVGNDIVENEQLLDAYDDAIGKYRKAWNEAYEEINNEAEAFADKIYKALFGGDKEYLLKGAEEFGLGIANAINGVFTPDNFGGLASAIATVIETVFVAFLSFKENVNYEKIGESIATFFNVLFKSIDVSKVAEGMSAISAGLQEIITGFFENFDFGSALSFALKAITVSVGRVNLKTNRNLLARLFVSALEKEMPNGVTVANLPIALLKLSLKVPKAIEDFSYEIAKKIEELTEKIFPEIDIDLSPILDTIFGEIFNFNKTKDATTFAENAFVEIEKAFYAGDWKSLGEKIVEGVFAGFLIPVTAGREVFANFSNLVIDGIRNAFDLDGNAKDLFSLGKNIAIKVTDGFKEIKTEFYLVINDWYNNYVVTWFSEKKWNFVGITDGLEKAFNSAFDVIKGIWNGFAKWINEALDLEFEGFSKKFSVLGNEIKIGIPSFNVQLGKLPTFQTGGFPEDGLFMANHSELVGKFSNGKTAVANNDQITKGIEEAAYRGMVRALQNADMGSKATFEIVGDPNGMFRVMQKQANQYTKSTGRNAFGY